VVDYDLYVFVIHIVWTGRSLFGVAIEVEAELGPGSGLFLFIENF
jgi:hypothetical protein